MQGSNGSTEDGLLQAREIAPRLGARIVDLSGCNTGRPFFEALSPTRAWCGHFCSQGKAWSQLWTIDDTFTAYLMGQFTDI